MKFLLPTKLTMGSGTLSELPNVVVNWGKSTLLVTGPNAMKRLGILDKVVDLLSSAGIRVVLFNKVKSEPNLEDVKHGVELAKDERVEMVIGLGGGSAMDCAKAIAGTADKEGVIEEYMEGKDLEAEGLPLITIPTTAGTGAEVTPNAVLINKEKRIKRSFRSPHLFPKEAIIDPELTVSLPPQITAYSGMDALCQAIESFVSLGANPVTDALSLKAIELIGGSITQAYEDGSKLSFRERMMYGSLLSGMAMCNSRMGVVHGIVHPLGAIYGLPHGLLCGMLLPFAMEFNLEVVAEKYAIIARALGEDAKGLSPIEAGKLAILRIRQIIANLKFPLRLGELGVRKEDFPKIARDSMPSGSLKANPRKVSEEDIEELLKRAW